VVITVAALAFGSLVAHKSHMWYYLIVSLCCCVSLSWSPSLTQLRVNGVPMWCTLSFN
jgi:hypothetical protein